MTEQQSYFDAVGELYAAHDAEMKTCSVCGRVMAEHECGDELPDERVCDECAGVK